MQLLVLKTGDILFASKILAEGIGSFRCRFCPLGTSALDALLETKLLTKAVSKTVFVKTIQII